MKQLSVERIFSDPPLVAQLPAQVHFSPDGSVLTYLAISDDDRERLDLYAYDLGTEATTRLVDASSLTSADAAMTDAEKAERERKRFFSTGISHYAWHPGGDELLLVSDGSVLRYRVADGRITTVTAPGTRQTDVSYSATGRHISFVRDGDLYLHDTATGAERQLTHDASEVISNGMPDFIAAEEMHRFSGYWWSPDDTFLAYTRVDTSPVAVSHRIEINADAFTTYPQRYPYAGQANADVTLELLDLATGSSRQVDYARESDDYLARVKFANDTLVTVAQSRSQRRLWVTGHPTDGSVSTVLLEEEARTWLNLHDNLTFIDGTRDFLWSSERGGISQLYRYQEGETTCLTPARFRVERVVRADADVAHVLGWQDDPTQQHLYRVPLSGNQMPEPVTNEEGWHDCEMSPDAAWWADRFSSPEQPPCLKLTSTDGKAGRVLAGVLDGHHPYAPYLARHVEPEFGQLSAADGQPLFYRLTRPAELVETARYPAIVLVYGGPGVQRVRREWSALTTQLFAQAGFAVLEIDNRGSGWREKGFEDPICGVLGEVEVADQVTGAGWLASLPWIDEARIGVLGHSYGGYLTLMCLAKAAEVFKAGVAVAPVTDWRLYDTHYTERYLGTPERNAKGYDASSVLTHADGIRGALLVVHGMADDNVLFTNSTKLFKALQDRGQQFEMMTYPGAKHALQERSVAIHRFTAILNFFSRHLGTPTAGAD